ncbi:MAG: IS1380 family transposase [FCB group bacterium]|nr:IS1380 family transposase [FCB group bacterium]
MQPFSQNILSQNDTQQTLFSSDSAISSIQNKKVALDFEGGSITSDAGVLLLSEVEKNIGIIETLTACISDKRNPFFISHTVRELLSQRVFQIVCGYEDANDSNSLRKDPAIKMAVGRLPENEDQDLGSQPTISRLENSITPKELHQMANGFVSHFISSYQEAPKVIILDFDDTDDHVHGKQQLALFNGYYGETCYQPLHVYEGFSGKLITTVLRPGKRPGGREILSYLKRIVSSIRKQWPDTIMVYRGDSHYSVPEVFEYLSGQENTYSLAGLTSNAILLKHVQPLINQVQDKPAGYKRYHTFQYQAKSWSEPRKVVAKVEMTEKGLNIRFISTDMLRAKAKNLYEEIYCARGNDELYIKDHKTYTKSDRTSCHRFMANQFRLFLHSAAYVLLHTYRSELLRGTSMATATFDTIRLKLLKVGARIIELKTKIKVHMPTAYPFQDIFSKSLKILECLRGQHQSIQVVQQC